MSSLRKRITVGLVGAAVVAGGGIAYAASQSSDPRDAYLDDVAKRLNVTPEKLREAMKGASLDQLEQAVKDGKLTQQQADRAKQKIEAGGIAGPILGRGLRGGPDLHARGGGFAFKAVGGVLEDVATELGLSTAELRRQLVSGKSLADVAKAKGKSVDDVKKTITDAARSHLDEAVKDGDLTQKQADAVRSKLAANLDELVTASPPRIAGRAFKGRGPGFGGMPRGHAFGFGFGKLGFGADIEAVADYLGITTAQLRERIADGKSLADVAKAEGKSVDGLKKTITDRARKRLDEAVKDGDLTKAQADNIAEKLSDHLDELVELGMPRFKRP